MYETNLKAVTTIAAFLLRCSPISRVKIAQISGLTASIVTKTIQKMVQCHFVEETGKTQNSARGSGRSRKLLAINPEFAAFLGIELNVAGIYGIVVDCTGHILAHKRLRTEGIPPAAINEKMLDLASSLIQQSPLKIYWAGLGVPGHLGQEDRFLSNNPQWSSLDLSLIRKKIELPLIVENNIEAMAFGEYLFESEKTPDHFMLLHIGPGMYCASFESEYIDTDRDFYTGEIGHMVADPQGSLCECGKTGCLQTFISDSWLIRKARLIWESSDQSVLRALVNEPKQINMDVIRKAYLLQDPLVRRDLDNGISKLALTLGNILIMSRARKVFINSLLLQEAELAEKLKAGIAAQLDFIGTRKPVEIEILPYDEYRGAQGAAALAEYQYFVQNPRHFYERILARNDTSSKLPS